MCQHRRGVVGLAVLIAIAVSAMAAGMFAQKAISEHPEAKATTLHDLGSQVGGIVAGPAGSALGGELGYLLAAVLGITAAQRHGAATAATAQLRTLKPSK